MSGRHIRIEKPECQRCKSHTVKRAPRSCLAEKDYSLCHKLCPRCWRREKPDNYNEINKNVHCWVCCEQKCWVCGSMGGEWHDDIRKVLCYDCL